MRSLRYTPLALLLLAAPVQAQHWTTVDLGTTEDLYAMTRAFVWVVGTNGFVAKADPQDYTSWTTASVGTTEDLLSVIAPTSGSHSIAGRNGTYRITSDGGTTWNAEDLPDATQDYIVTRPNSTWFALGSGGQLYADEISSGVNWVERVSSSTVALNDMEANATPLIVGDGGTILRGGNPTGLTWTPVASGTTANLHAVARWGATDWLVVGEGGLILKSTDDGATWTPRESGTTSTLYALSTILSATQYLVVGEDGTILETTDFGDTWCRHDAGTTATLRAVMVPQGSREWLVAGDGGLMLRSTTQGGGNCTPVVSTESGPDLGFTLSAPWPNPMASRAALALSVDRPQRVVAELVDGLGRRLAVLFDGEARPGVPQTLVVERNGLAAGSYLVRVRGETFAASRHVTLLR